MSLDKGSPGPHPLNRIGIVGNPYHGLVSGGSLTLPNAEVKAYPQPDSTWPDLAGTTHLLRKPGQPAVSRTTEQQTSDDAKGWQWRNVAMLSGGNQQLYGHDINGWIYIDPDGVRWLITFVTPLLSLTVGIGSPLSLQAEVTRFGEFGGTPESFTTTLTLTDWGQSGYPSLPSFATGGAPENVSSLGFFLEAVTPSGSKAAISANFPRTDSLDPSDSTVDVAVRHALGWLEIAVTSVDGLPSLSLSVLKNRAETLITVTNTGASTPAADSVQPALIAGGGTTTVKTGSSTREHELKRLVGVWVDPDTDEWRWVALRYRYAADTVSTFGGSVGLSYVANVSGTSTESMALEVDDVEQVALDMSYTFSGSMTATYSGTDPSVKITLHRLPEDRQLIVDGVEYNETTAGGSPVIGSDGADVILDIANYGAGGSLAFDDLVLRTLLFQMQWRFAARLSLSSPQPYAIRIDLCRQSGQVFTIRFHLLSGTEDEFTYFKRVTPTGLSGSKTSRPYSATERFYGSWCPHTNAVSSMQASPVCWV